MKAAVLRETNGALGIEELATPDPASGEVLVRLLASGVCHTDIAGIEGHYNVPLPAVFGHEGIGVVERIGVGVASLAPGDRVLISQPVCGTCWFCARGEPYLCELKKKRLMAGTTLNGTTPLKTAQGETIYQFFCQSSFAEYAVIDQRAAVPIGNDVPPDVVAPLACGASTGMGAVLNVAHVEPGSTVAVFGCGGVGLSAIMAAAHVAGARSVIGVDVVGRKLELAADIGATHTINASKGDPVAEVRRLTGGGVDYAVESIGKASVIAQAYDSVRPGGTAVVAGVPPPGTSLAINPAGLIGGKALLGCVMGAVRPRVELPRYVDLFRQGKLPLDRLVTHRFPLSEINAAIAALRRGEVGRAVLIYE